MQTPISSGFPTLLKGAVSQIEIYCNEQMCTVIRRILLALYQECQVRLRTHYLLQLLLLQRVASFSRFFLSLHLFLLFI